MFILLERITWVSQRLDAVNSLGDLVAAVLGVLPEVVHRSAHCLDAVDALHDLREVVVPGTMT